MATDLQTRQAISKPDAYLQSKFADLCTRIRRVDRIKHLLTILLMVACYSLLRGWFDFAVGNSSATWAHATRWSVFVAFVVAFGFLFMRTASGWFCRVNPYYVAHALESSNPDAKNGLINWLDLHDEDLPGAFQKHLSGLAAQQWQDDAAEQTLAKRQNWILLGALAAPGLGLLVLLLLGPAAFLSSMLHAFWPFHSPASVARTQIALVAPSGDVEVLATQGVTFTAGIEGRVPAAQRPDAPALRFRYAADEDYIVQPLQRDADGSWTTQLFAGQLRTGLAYKLSAGDAETPEYKVRVRARAHVEKFEIAYEPREYRKLPRSTRVFPNADASKPIIHGMRGTKVELTIHASRPVEKASIEIVTARSKQTPALSLKRENPHVILCSFVLHENAQFRVAFTTTDGEVNLDRELYDIIVRDDAAPSAVLAEPGKNVTLPANGMLEIAGHASDDVGLKRLALQMRVVNGPKTVLAPLVYRSGQTFEREDGSYPAEIEYRELLMLDQIRNDKGTTIEFAAGTILEYWLEAVDNADYPNPAGNLGKSSAYQITLTKASKDSSLAQERKQAIQKQQKHQKDQEQKLAQGPKKSPSTGAGQPNPEEQLNAVNKDKQETEQKIKQALNEDKKNQERAGAKGADQKTADKKDGPQPGADEPQPTQKDQPPQSPDDTGNTKEQGDKGSPGESRDSGAKKKGPQEPSKGERKDGSKDAGSSAKDGGEVKMKEPAGGAKDAGMMGMDTPMPQQPKDNAGADQDAPMPSAKKSEPRDSDPQQGSAKGIEKNGPEIPNKDQDTAQHQTAPPDGLAKGSKRNEDSQGTSKQGDPGAGLAKDDGPRQTSKEPSWDDLATQLDDLPRPGEPGNAAGEKLADLAKNAPDPRMREMAVEILVKNGRDPKTGKEDTKAKNPFGSSGQSAGISDDIQTKAANRAFASRIGQLQLDDWKKRLTPELLRKAGVSEPDWQRYLKDMQRHDSLVRQLNAKLLRDSAKTLKGGPGTLGSGGPSIVVGPGGSNSLQGDDTGAPPQFRDAQRRFTNPANP